MAQETVRSLQFAQRFRTGDRILVTRQADVTILLDLQRGRYYTLNPVSGFIWSLMEGGSSLEGVIARVHQEFDISTENVVKDVEEFVSSLITAKLVHQID